jgi:IS30 family transposase
MSPWERAKCCHYKARRRRSESKRGKRGALKFAVVQNSVQQLLEERRYSPEKIADCLRQGDGAVKVCGRTVRRWVCGEVPHLKQFLPCRGKKYRKRVTHKKFPKPPKRAAPKRSIHERPELIGQRLRVGDFEIDAIVCDQSTAAIISVRERKTRQPWLRKVDNLKADTVKSVLVSIFGDIPPPLRLSCTYDNGGEFAEHLKLKILYDIESYFCDAYKAWQKGAVENQNKDVRLYIPKGTDISKISRERLAEIERFLREKPMDCLDHLSPGQAWELALRATSHLLH